MHVTLVHVHVKAERVNDFIEATKINHELSTRERGNRRFDVLQLADDPTCFVLYEAYDTPADATAHKATSHYLPDLAGQSRRLDGRTAERGCIPGLVAEVTMLSGWRAELRDAVAFNPGLA